MKKTISVEQFLIENGITKGILHAHKSHLGISNANITKLPEAARYSTISMHSDDTIAANNRLHDFLSKLSEYAPVWIPGERGA